jgi:integrase
MRNALGPTMARRAGTLLRGALQLAVLNNVLGSNPVRDVQTIRSKSAPKGAQALTAEQLRELLIRIRASETCERRDLADPITLLIATGPRRSELLALRWSDFDPAAGTVAVCGKVVRQSGKGLFRVDETKREPRPRQPRRTLAPTARRVGRAGRQLAQPPQVAGNADRRHRPDTTAWPRQGSAEATVKHQPKHCRPSAEAEMSAISRRITP